MPEQRMENRLDCVRRYVNNIFDHIERRDNTIG